MDLLKYSMVCGLGFVAIKLAGSYRTSLSFALEEHKM